MTLVRSPSAVLCHLCLLVAGSSEGRVFFARYNASVNAFDLPVALTVGDGDTSTEILVQGGYRVDIQGPAESRWG